MGRLGDAGGHDEKVGVLLAWGEAAGGDVSCIGENVTLVLPSHLPKGIALAELHRFAHELHVEVTTRDSA
jgi:hypothetical protein